MEMMKPTTLATQAMRSRVIICLAFRVELPEANNDNSKTNNDNADDRQDVQDHEPTTMTDEDWTHFFAIEEAEPNIIGKHSEDEQDRINLVACGLW
jgi:hypothetical protein